MVDPLTSVNFDETIAVPGGTAAGDYHCTVDFTSGVDGGIIGSQEIWVTVPDPIIEVEIDIKPGSDPSCFNNDGNGVIPVAIFGTATLDVNDIDAETVELEGMEIQVAGKSNKLLANIEDVNEDGYDDLVVKIEDTDGVFDVGSTMATLTGSLLDGTQIQGTGDICITQ